MAISGTDGPEVLNGTPNDDEIWGGDGDDVLNGLGGNDRLYGGASADTTNGGIGDDWHFIDNAGDVVIGQAGEGNDRVFAGMSYTLTAGAEVEILSTDWHEGFGAINLIRIIYDQATGALLFDADGSGAGAAQLSPTSTARSTWTPAIRRDLGAARVPAIPAAPGFLCWSDDKL